MRPSCPPGRGLVPERKGHQAGPGAWLVLRDSGKRTGVFPRGLPLCVHLPSSPRYPWGHPLSPCHSHCLQTVFSSAPLSSSRSLPLSLLRANGCFLFIKANFSGMFTVFDFLVGQAGPGRAEASKAKISRKLPGREPLRWTWAVSPPGTLLGHLGGVPRPERGPFDSPLAEAGPPVGRGPDFMNKSFILSVTLAVCQPPALKQNQVSFTGGGNEPFLLEAPVISPKRGPLHLISGGTGVRSPLDKEFGVDSL